MAFVTNFICHDCGKNVHGVAAQYGPDLCGDCIKIRNDIHRRQHFQGLDGLTLEERVRKIEEHLYERSRTKIFTVDTRIA